MKYWGSCLRKMEVSCAVIIILITNTGRVIAFVALEYIGQWVKLKFFHPCQLV